MSSFGHYGPALLMLASVLITSCGSETGDRVLLRVSIEVPIDKASPLTISQDNTMVAISGYNEKIVLVDLVSGEVTATVDNAHARRALNAEFINRLYTSSWDSIKSWERPNGRPAVSIHAGGKVVRTKFYGAIASGSETHTGTFTGERMDGSIDYFSVTPEEEYVLAVAKNGGQHSIATWSLLSGRQIASVAGAETAILSPDGIIAAVSRKKQIGKTDMGTSVKFNYHYTSTLYSVPYLRKKKTLKGLWAIAFSPDRAAILGRTDEEQFGLQKIDGGTIATFPFEGYLRHSRFSRDGQFVLLSSGSSVACYDTRSGEQLWKHGMGSDEGGDVIQVTADNQLAIFKADGAGAQIRFVDLRTGEERARISGESIFTGFALSPDGRTLATTMYKGGLALWDIET